MTIVTPEEVGRHLNLDVDLFAQDAIIIASHTEAAQDHCERLLGFTFAERYTGDENPPHSLKHAVKLLAAHWYENREASLIGVSGQTVPFGVHELINEYRAWSWA